MLWYTIYMKSYFGLCRHLSLTTLLLSLMACIPSRSPSGTGSSGSGSSSIFDRPDNLAVGIVRVGASAAINAEIYNGQYFSKYDPVTMYGTCSGNVKKILVEDTPQGGSTTSQTLNCSNETFIWNKSLPAEKTYTIVFTPQDSNGSTIGSVATQTRTYTYDITNPTAPAFISPTTGTSYTITNGVTSVTIIGMVLNETIKLIGPNSVNINLVDNPDGIHKNFTYNTSVAVGTSSSFQFTAYDAATNSASRTITIDSVLNLSMPVAAQEIGGSHATPTGMRIESSVGFMSEVVLDTNSNVKKAIGSAGIMGNL